MTERDRSRDQPYIYAGHQLDRLTVAQAAKRLGITEAGVRKRVQRGQIPHERDEARKLWVWVSAEEDSPTQSRDQASTNRDELIEELRRTNELLREVIDRRDEELREHRRLLAGLLERVPELEAPATQEPTEADVTTEEEPEGATEPRSYAPGAQEPVQRRSWWEFWR